MVASDKSILHLLKSNLPGAFLAAVFAISGMGCGSPAGKQVGFDITFEKAVPLSIDGYELSTPLLYPDEEYGGVYIASGNSNTICRYDPAKGLEAHLEPVDTPPGAGGVAALCYADGDFFLRPAIGKASMEAPARALYHLTKGGRIRFQDISPESFEDVLSFGILVYLGDGRLLIETHPKGPFVIVDLVTGDVERHPTEFPPRDTVQTVVPDFGAREVYLVRRAKDMSVYFLRFPFKGRFRGVEYILRREFFAAAATVEDIHLFQYGSGKVDAYDILFKRLETFDLAKLVEKKYTIMLGLTVVRGYAYLIGLRGPVIEPEGYDLLIFRVEKPKAAK